MSDPTVQYIPITLGDTTYQLAFDLGSLADAEAAINKEGGNVNLLRALDFSNLTLSAVQVLFACSIRKAHPEITFNDAKALVTMKTLYPIADVLYRTWLESVGVNDTDEKKVSAENQAQAS